MAQRKINYEEVYDYLEDSIEEVFENFHMEAETKYGDITPEQSMYLDELTTKLTELIVKQVNQNISIE